MVLMGNSVLNFFQLVLQVSFELVLNITSDCLRLFFQKDVKFVPGQETNLVALDLSPILLLTIEYTIF